MKRLMYLVMVFVFLFGLMAPFMVLANDSVYIQESFDGVSVAYNSIVSAWNAGIFSKNGTGTFEVGTTGDDSYLHISKMNATVYKKLMPNVTYASKREVEIKFQFSGLETTEKVLWMNILKIKNASAFDTATRPTGSADNDQYLYLNAGVSTHILAPITADDWHTVKMVFTATSKTVHYVELDGTPITTLVNGTAFPVAGINLGTHGGYTLDLNYVSDNTYLPTFKCDEYADLKISEVYYGAVQNASVVSTSVENNAQISTNGSVSFTFDMNMNPTSFTNSTVKLYEGSKVRLCSGIYNSTSKTYTVSFADAPLAPLTQYSIVLSTGLLNSSGGGLAENYTLNFSTTYDGSYIYDNFTRFPNMRISGYPAEALPWVKTESGHGGQLNDFNSVGGRSAISIITKPATYGASAYMAVGYNTSYMPNISYSATRVAEVEFDFSGDKLAEVSIWSELLKIKAYDAANSNYTPYLFANEGSMGFIPIAPVSSGITHKVKLIYKANPRVLYAVEIDGVPVIQLPNGADFPADGILLTSHGSYPIDFKYNAAGTGMTMFKLNTRSDTLGCTEESRLNIYNVKYYPYASFNISSISVADGANNVDNTGKIDVVFDKRMADATLNNQTITLIENGKTTPVAYKGSYDALTSTYTLNLREVSLKTSASYTLTVTTDVKDYYSGALTANQAIVFTTAMDSNKKVNLLYDGAVTVTEGETTFSVTIENITDMNVTNGLVVYAVYKQNSNVKTLLGVDIKQFSVNAYQTTDAIIGSITVPAIGEEDTYAAAAMVIDGLNTLKPISNKRVLNN